MFLLFFTIKFFTYKQLFERKKVTKYSRKKRSHYKYCFWKVQNSNKYKTFPLKNLQHCRIKLSFKFPKKKHLNTSTTGTHPQNLLYTKKIQQTQYNPSLYCRHPKKFINQPQNQILLTQWNTPFLKIPFQFVSKIFHRTPKNCNNGKWIATREAIACCFLSPPSDIWNSQTESEVQKRRWHIIYLQPLPDLLQLIPPFHSYWGVWKG